MGHVNNAAYIDYLEEALLAVPDGAPMVAALPRRLRIEYLASAAPGDELAGAVWRLPDDEWDDGWAWNLEAGGSRELARARILDQAGPRTDGRMA